MEEEAAPSGGAETQGPQHGPDDALARAPQRHHVVQKVLPGARVICGLWFVKGEEETGGGGDLLQ